MAKAKNENDVQKKYLELQLFINQINQIQQQFVLVQNKINELNSLKENIGNFSKIKEGSESYVSLGLNVFTKAKLIEPKEFLISIGSDILIPKTIEETLKLIDFQIDEMHQITVELENQINVFDLKAQELQKDISESSNQ